MFNLSTLGAIFAIFILCAHCDNADIYNEETKIFVPSAPQNLTANRVTAEEIHLSWAPPLNSSLKVLIPDPPKPPAKIEKDLPPKANEPQSDQPNDVISEESEIQSDAPVKDYVYWFHGDKLNDDEEYRVKRESRSHRHRKRRQDNATETKHQLDKAANEEVEETHYPYDMPFGVAKKSVINSVPLKDPTKIAYVLYFEEGRPLSETVIGVPSSADVKMKNVFASDLNMDQYTKTTKNLTLLNTSGVLTKVVQFRLRNLKPFTPYKIWVRAFYNFSLKGVNFSELTARLGPSSEALYVLTDVMAPSPPIVLNLTCHQPKGILYIQWRQPLEYNNSIDQYVVMLRRPPEEQPRTKLTLPTSRNDIETTIMVNVDLSNSTEYEVTIYAVTKSVARQHLLVNGTESAPSSVLSSWCSVWPLAMSPVSGAGAAPSVPAAALLAVLPLALLAALAVALLYWRCRSRLSKCISAAYNYLEEGGERAARAPLNAYKKPVNCSPLVVCAGGGVGGEGECGGGGGGGGGVGVGGRGGAGRPPRISAPAHPAIAAKDFPRHVAALHADGDIGFSKEYEIVVAKSAALGHTSHHSHRPENRLKNRYLNITAYDHSRVCVSMGGRCGAAGCAGGGGGGGGGGAPHCDYVNANFIDGMLPALRPQHVARIRRKLLKRNEPNRQPSIKTSKPPPNLAEGIESAFLNIEFSGIVESDDRSDSDSSRSDDDDLDDVYVDIDDERTQVKLEWLIWRRRYIATQGPTPATVDAFWRMIWQHSVHTIVMITNLVERGRRKCDMYWPDGGRGSSAEFGGVRVTLAHEDVRAAYTVRHLVCTAGTNTPSPVTPTQDASSAHSSEATSGGTGTRTVVQYHYTVWPDHGTPRHPLQVLPLVRAASTRPDTILVHCSAGVGRTGTYIVLDAQLNQLKLTGTLSPLGFLCRARTQRNHLVQTEEQYVFVHDALLEHVRSGDTEIEFSKMREYLKKLLEPISQEELAVLDLNPPVKRKSVQDLTNGDNCETASVKSQNEDEKEIVENGSQLSIKTDELNSEMSKSSVNMDGDDSDRLGPREAVNGVNGVNGDDAEGVYDLAPRNTDTYTKKMQAYNSLSEQEKEEIRRVNRAENYALLERMRSLANRNHTYQGPPPVNLLEKQFLLISRSGCEASVCARLAHNAQKNRPGGALPTDTARVMLVPKPGVEGSEYINASWVCGGRRQREYAVAQHPPTPTPTPTAPPPTPPTHPTTPTPPTPAAIDLCRLLWDHTAQLVLVLTDTTQPDCEIFWPTEEEKELFVGNFRASFVSKETYVAYRKSDRKSPVPTPVEPETNGFRRQESECADDERLIPESSPVPEAEPGCRVDRTELRLERLSNRDLSARKSIANGDLFSSLSEKRNGPKSPRSPSKMSLKNFKLSSPTKFKFPEWGAKSAGSPPDIAPPPPPVEPALSVEEEIELRRPCYYFEKVDQIPENIPSDRIIEVTNVSVHSLQDDYQLNVKFIKCTGWLEGETVEYTAGKPENNEWIRAIREATSESEREEAIERLIAPFKDSFALIEFVYGCQMEYKNGPVVVVDKYGGNQAMSFCTLSAAGSCARNPAWRGAGRCVSPPAGAAAGAAGGAAPAGGPLADLYTAAAVAAHARAPAPHAPQSLPSLLAQYCALANYGPLLEQVYAACR